MIKGAVLALLVLGLAVPTSASASRLVLGTSNGPQYFDTSGLDDTCQALGYSPTDSTRPPLDDEVEVDPLYISSTKPDAAGPYVEGGPQVAVRGVVYVGACQSGR